MVLRIVVGMLSHETHTFSKIATRMEHFEEQGLYFGSDVIKAHEGQKTGIGGFLDALKDQDVEFIPTISAQAMPSGIVQHAVYERFKSEHLKRIKKAGRIDGILLALHGSLVVDKIPDGDGDFLESTRNLVGPSVPIMNTFDFHSTLSELKVRSSSGIFGYDTNPHIDLYERGIEAATNIVKTIRGEIKPTMVLVKPRMILPGVNASTWSPTGRDIPMVRLFKAAKQEETRPSVINVSISGGFPFSDVESCGMGVITITDDNPGLAREISEKIVEQTWSMRNEFVKPLTPVEDAIQQAVAAPEGPVFLIDVADDPGSGAPGDGTVLLKALIKHKTKDVAFGLIHDSAVVKQAVRSGVGKQITVNLGGKKDKRCGTPVKTKARIKLMSDGRYIESGPMGRGRSEDIGPTAVLEIDGISVIVTSRKTAPNDAELFRSLGMEPTEKKIVVIKSTQHYRASYEPIAKRIIEVDTPGIGTANLTTLKYKNVRRPIFPLDPLDDWR